MGRPERIVLAEDLAVEGGMFRPGIVPGDVSPAGITLLDVGIAADLITADGGAHLRLLGKDQVDPAGGSDVGHAAVPGVADAAGVDPLREPFAGLGETESAAEIGAGDFADLLQDAGAGDAGGKEHLRADFRGDVR